jgi:tRNA threonylcarbamoyladenosine biosynthesis protein TsaB
MLLAIDTATQNISLALHDGGELLYEQTWRSVNQHTVELAPAVEHMLGRLGDTPLAALAVAIGPGTYSGLRVGVSFAKAIAAARRVPLVGVTTLDILASAQPHFQGGLVAVVQAGRSRVVAASYQWRRGRWVARVEPQTMDWETLLNTIDGPALISGEIDADARARLAQARLDGMPITPVPAAVRLRRAGYLAEEAWLRLRAGISEEGAESDPTAFDPARIVPVYARTKDSP